jgi:hypothetical protein
MTIVVSLAVMLTNMGTRKSPTGTIRNKNASGNAIVVTAREPSTAHSDTGIKDTAVNCWATFTFVSDDMHQSMHVPAKIHIAVVLPLPI